MNRRLDTLQPYPFERLNALKNGIKPPADLTHIALSIGEPKHPTPAFVAEAVSQHLHTLSNYPLTRGMDSLRESIAGWLSRRFKLAEAGVDPGTQVLPVNGTREALFAFAQTVIDDSRQPYMLMPNPFYQIYEGAALLAGARPYFLNTTADNNLLPDFDAVPEQVWSNCQLLYVCSPGNPTGAVIDADTYAKLFELSDRYGFIIGADECYSEIYFDEDTPPPGLLEVAQQQGRHDFKNCVVFHSLSKRSNAPGLRSGFVAGDAEVLKQFLRYRTYHGCAMPPPTQHASILAWNDEAHVKHNRDLYRQKFAAVVAILSAVIDVQQPEAGFYLWLKTPNSDTDFARDLFATQNVTVLPGSFLSRDTDNGNPGSNYVRMALVADTDECIEAANRIKTYLSDLQ
jgi:N-succinyldiaminopimelate aminotransferase